MSQRTKLILKQISRYKRRQGREKNREETTKEEENRQAELTSINILHIYMFNVYYIEGWHIPMIIIRIIGIAFWKVDNQVK